MYPLSINKEESFSEKETETEGQVQEKPEIEKITIEKKDKNWFITSPVNARADQQFIDDLLGDLTTPNINNTLKVDKDKQEKFKKFGLDSPTYQVQIFVKKEDLLKVVGIQNANMNVKLQIVVLKIVILKYLFMVLSHIRDVLPLSRI